MLTTRTEVIKTAREWLDTPFHHQARMKGIGCDCIGLIIGVAKELRIQSKQNIPLHLFDECNYDHEIENNTLIEKFERHLIPIQQVELGCIAVFGKEDSYKHVGIIGDYNTSNFSLIHTCIKHQKTLEHRLTPQIQKKIYKLYRFYNIN